MTFRYNLNHWTVEWPTRPEPSYVLEIGDKSHPAPRKDMNSLMTQMRMPVSMVLPILAGEPVKGVFNGAAITIRQA